MRVEIHDKLKGSFSIEATRVVVYDDYDNPIALAVNIDGGQYIVATITNKAFNKLLKTLGINKTVILDTLDTTKLKPLL